MMRGIISLLLVAAAIIIFVVVVNPRFSTIRELRAEAAEYNEALANARRLKEARDSLRERYNSFDGNDIDRLEMLIPDNINNMKVVLELDVLAAKHGLSLRNIQVAEKKETAPTDPALGIPEEPYGTVELQFSIEGSYNSFVGFLKDVENSLRLIDVRHVTFQSLDVGDRYQFNVTLETYWLKQ